MWGLLLDKVLPESDVAKVRGVLEVFVKSRSMAQSNVMDFHREKDFTEDDQVAKQVHIVV